MGVRRILSRGGQKFSKGGGKNLLFARKTTKKILFSQKKVQKHYIFGRTWPARGGGQVPPLPSPVDAHENDYKRCFNIQYCTTRLCMTLVLQILTILISFSFSRLLARVLICSSRFPPILTGVGDVLCVYNTFAYKRIPITISNLIYLP
jgi:hypothetical protein